MRRRAAAHQQEPPPRVSPPPAAVVVVARGPRGPLAKEKRAREITNHKLQFYFFIFHLGKRQAARQ